MPDGTPPSVWRWGRVRAGRRATVFVGASNFRSSTLASLKMGSSDGGGDRTECGGGYGSAVNDLWTGGTGGPDVVVNGKGGAVAVTGGRSLKSDLSEQTSSSHSSLTFNKFSMTFSCLSQCVLNKSCIFCNAKLCFISDSLLKSFNSFMNLSSEPSPTPAVTLTSSSFSSPADLTFSASFASLSSSFSLAMSG